ncbi:ELMO domain-containing protein A [Linum perenne]
MVGPRAWLGGLFNRFSKQSDKYPNDSSPHLVSFLFRPQEQRLARLQKRVQTPFDETRPDHQEALQCLWSRAFPDVPLTGMITEQWKEMGWQGVNPATDFRGCGFIALENLLFFARTYPGSFRRLLFKQCGKRSEWEYPFAVAGINVSYMLIQMLDLQSGNNNFITSAECFQNPTEDDTAFDVLFCITFQLMDAQWLAMRASYMEFSEVLQVTRAQLERELVLEDIHRVIDLPAYLLLYQ